MNEEKFNKIYVTSIKIIEVLKTKTRFSVSEVAELIDELSDDKFEAAMIGLNLADLLSPQPPGDVN